MTVIRPLLVSDYEAVRRIDIATQPEYRGVAWDMYPSEQQARYLWCNPEDFAIQVETGFSFAYIQDGELVGFVTAFREPLPARGRLYTDGIAVAKEHRRSGVASALYRAMITAARAAGIAEIVTRISLDNEQSLRLHEAAGFKLTECVEATLEL